MGNRKCRGSVRRWGDGVKRWATRYTFRSGGRSRSITPQDDRHMAEEKTRIIPKKGAVSEPVEPRVVNGQIVFFCPAGHRLAVPVNLGGKRGKCGKCGVFLEIPQVEPEAEAEETEATAEPVGEAPAEEAVPASAIDPAAAEPAEPAAEADPQPPAADAAEWNFVGGEPAATGEPLAAESWPNAGEPQPFVGEGEANPTAQLVARLWAERNHGGIIELHLVGGNVILPEEFAARWSRGTHGLFASQAADGTVTLTAVAWDTIQRIVVRQLKAVPDDMFE